jgi:hypothetical protein
MAVDHATYAFATKIYQFVKDRIAKVYPPYGYIPSKLGEVRAVNVAVNSDGGGYRVVELGDDAKNVTFLSGAPCNLLLSFRDNLLVSAGNTLYIVSNDGLNPFLGLGMGVGFGMLLRLVVRFLFRSMVRVLQVSMSLRILRTSGCL